jgi:hypothetical protein
MKTFKIGVFVAILALLVAVGVVAQQSAWRDGRACALAVANIRQAPRISAAPVGVLGSSQAKTAVGRCYTLDWIITPNATETRTVPIEAWLHIVPQGGDRITNAGWVAINYNGTPFMLVEVAPILYSPTPSRTPVPPTATASPTQQPTMIPATVTAYPTPTQEIPPDVTLLPPPTSTPFCVLGITPERGRIVILTSENC